MKNFFKPDGSVWSFEADGTQDAYITPDMTQMSDVDFDSWRSPPSEHHTFNWQTKQWEDPRTLQEIKDAQWALIKKARTRAEYAGFTWDGSTFDSDAISQNRITGAVTLAQLSNTFTIDWTLATNQVRTLNQSEMLQVGAALGVHVQTQFAKGQSLRVQIDAATTQAEVEAVVW